VGEEKSTLQQRYGVTPAVGLIMWKKGRNRGRRKGWSKEGTEASRKGPQLKEGFYREERGWQAEYVSSHCTKNFCGLGGVGVQVEFSKKIAKERMKEQESKRNGGGKETFNAARR